LLVIHIYIINNLNRIIIKTEEEAYIMDKIRFTLIIIHILITIFLIYNFYPHKSLMENASHNEKQISLIIGYINDSLRITLYHSSCIIAIWYSRRYAAGMIRATGVLLIGEFLQILSFTIQHMVERHHIYVGEIIFDVIYVWLFIISIILTFRLAKKISNYHKDLMRLELISTTSNQMLMDEGGGEFSLV